MIKIKSRLVNGNLSVKPGILELESALNAVFRQELDSIKIRSQPKWAEEGERPSSFFFKLCPEFCLFFYNSSGTEVCDREK